MYLYLDSLSYAFQDIVNAKVLELGCGTGFLGIVISQLQLLYHSTDLRRDGSSHRTSICLTDANEDVLKRCKENVLLRCSEFLFSEACCFLKIPFDKPRHIESTSVHRFPDARLGCCER
jgi:methylase of polypeptide subunit release factors